ncbi:hypothetical protein Tco_0999166 [Tanacetum coccineum]
MMAMEKVQRYLAYSDEYTRLGICGEPCSVAFCDGAGLDYFSDSVNVAHGGQRIATFLMKTPVIKQQNTMICLNVQSKELQEADGYGGVAPTRLPLLQQCRSNNRRSAFFHSPSPRSLPLPSFFNKKQDSMALVTDHDAFDDSATKHLCSLLRLG